MKSVSELKKISKKMRREILKMVFESKSGHLGCSLGITDILAVLYFNILNIDPKKPKNTERDRFILSKGHASSALYAVLAEKGFFAKKLLNTYFANGSILPGHVTYGVLAGIDATAGALGHGLSVGVGMALAQKHKKYKSKVYVLIGDGECEEGSIWEAIMFAGHHRINNLILILDYNNLQILGKTTDILNSYPLKNKFESFGWRVKEIDGHNISQLLSVFNNNEVDKPLAIITKTKGKGVSFMENRVEWHGKSPTSEEYKKAIKELS